MMGLLLCWSSCHPSQTQVCEADIGYPLGLLQELPGSSQWSLWEPTRISVLFPSPNKPEKYITSQQKCNIWRIKGIGILLDCLIDLPQHDCICQEITTNAELPVGNSMQLQGPSHLSEALRRLPPQLGQCYKCALPVVSRDATLIKTCTENLYTPTEAQFIYTVPPIRAFRWQHHNHWMQTLHTQIAFRPKHAC